VVSAPTVSSAPTTGIPAPGGDNNDGPEVDRATFDGIDTDGDGMISSDEFQTFVHSGGNSGGVGFVDVDDDGSMSVEEAEGAGINRSTFDGVDADGNGAVSRDEFQTFVDGSGDLVIVHFNDEDGDGFMSFDETGEQGGDGAGQPGTGTTSDDDGGAPIVPIIVAVAVAVPLLIFVCIFFLCPAAGCLALCKNRAERDDTRHKQPGFDNPTYGSSKDGFGFGFGADQSNGYLEVDASK
jgi:hypothetical protein